MLSCGDINNTNNTAEETLPLSPSKLRAVVPINTDVGASPAAGGAGGPAYGSLTITNGHKIATFLQRFKFYFPARDQQPIQLQQDIDGDINGDVDKAENGTAKRKVIIYPPSLEKAWKYFEYQCLPRRFATSVPLAGTTGTTSTGTIRSSTLATNTNGRKFIRASPGGSDDEITNPTKLYPVYGTPMNDMADFGIGVGMYFRTLRFFGIVTFIAGCLSIPSMMHYSSTDYSPTTTTTSNASIFGGASGKGTEVLSNALNKYSAVCTNVHFQPCPSCTRDQWTTFPKFNGRLLFTNNDEMAFILVNQCSLDNGHGYGDDNGSSDGYSEGGGDGSSGKLDLKTGIFPLVTLVFILCSVYFFAYLQRKWRIELDEGEQTSSDYSIQIMNPPNSSTARDPETWKKFFEERFEHLHVTICTVAIENEPLIKLLLQRHKLQNKIQNLLPPTIVYDKRNIQKMVEHCESPSTLSRILCCGKDAKQIYKTIQDVESKIQETEMKIDSNSDSNSNATGTIPYYYGISNVFVTFETEEMQRIVLETMKVPKLRRKEVDEGMKFEGQVLQFRQPDEPSSIRWFDLYASFQTRMKLMLFSFSSSIVLIFAAGVLISYAKTDGAVTSTIAIILLNSLTPRLVRILTRIESHDTESSVAASMYIKVTCFRWVNTAIVTSVVTPFTDYLQTDRLMESLRILFTAELMQRPILQLVDYIGHLKRHVLGPRKPDQRRMNLMFTAASYSIGERYTDFTKVLFLTFYYCTLFPIGFFFASAILFIYYWMDKFCILRTWRQGPKINADISMYSTHFLWLTVLAYSLIGAYSYSSFPFDNACLTDEAVPNDYVGSTFDIKSGIWSGMNFTVTSDDRVYKYCSQDLFRGGFMSFPLVPFTVPRMKEWMDPSQEVFSTIYGWVFVGILVLVTFSISLRLTLRFVKPLFVKTLPPMKVLSTRGFSDVREIFGYVPQVKLGGFEYPILLCDIVDIDNTLIGWTGDFKSSNLIYEVPESIRKYSFSIIKDWDPKKTEKIAESPSPTSRLGLAANTACVPNEESLAYSMMNYFFGSCT